MYFDLANINARDRHKLMTSTVVPRPIAWIVTQDQAGNLNAAPFSYFNAFSHDPPAVCIGIGSRDGVPKDSAQNIHRTGEFVVNLVSEDMVQKMNITAIDFDSGVNELVQAGLSTRPSVKVKPPRIAESPVSMECERIINIALSPSRTIVIGRVLAMHVRDDAVLDVEKRYIDTPKLNLVARMEGSWYSRTTDRFHMPRIDVKEWTLRGNE